MYETHKYTPRGQNSGYFSVTVSLQKVTNVPKNQEIKMYQYLVQISQALTSSGFRFGAKRITL